MVLAESSCMRDEEWSLLRLTLSLYGGGQDGTDGSDDGDDDDLWGSDGGNGDGGDDNIPRALSSSGSSAHASFWVQRTGGDLCRLAPADLEDEQTADAIAADEARRRRGALRGRARPAAATLEQPQPCFSFQGESLYADAAAEALLAQISPELAGQGGVVVNAGPAEAAFLPPAMLRRVLRRARQRGGGG
jgi:hypothetical protein